MTSQDRYMRYVTRWALTSGIRVMYGTYSDNGLYFHSGRISTCLRARDTFETLEDAIRDAKSKAVRKAVLLRRQADKLEDPNWTPKVVEVKS